MKKDFKEISIIGPSVLAGLLRDITDDVPEFAEITKSKSFYKRVVPRESENEDPYLEITLVYLQDYSSPLENLDERVLKSIENALKEKGLTDVVSDVIVNLSRLRKGEIVN